MYYTLIHNKDVTLKGFLRGCRSSRLNHVTLVFTVFLFYAFFSASTLVYTTWYNTSLLIIIIIFYMVSEPNFVLGIKQISLIQVRNLRLSLFSHSLVIIGFALKYVSFFLFGF